MMIFSGIVPHPPFLIPSIGKKNTEKLKATAEAFARFEQELYVSKPDTLVIISPHGPILPDAFMINLSASYTVNFKEFGDYQTTKIFHSDFLLIDRIQRNVRKETPLVLANEEVLDYGAGIPLYLLTAHLPQAALVPVSTSGLDYKQHYQFGKLLKEEVMNSNKRIAVLASADLSHTLTSGSPAGYAKEGAELDKTIQDLLNAGNAAGLIDLNQETSSKARECGVRPIAVLLGILDGVRYQTLIHSYEHPFGIGYMVANLSLT